MSNPIIKNIFGDPVEVTDLGAAISQCESHVELSRQMGDRDFSTTKNGKDIKLLEFHSDILNKLYELKNQLT